MGELGPGEEFRPDTGPPLFGVEGGEKGLTTGEPTLVAGPSFI